MVDRRQHKRFQINGKALAYYRTHSPKVAEVIDLNNRGLSFSYIGSAEPTNSAFELDIMFPDRTDYVDGLPCKTVSDRKIDEGKEDYSGTRRCSVRFGELTGKQLAKIESLIENFCWTVSN